MSTEATVEQLYTDLKAVIRDAEALLKSSNEIGGEKIEAVRARAEETFKRARARLEAAEEETVRRTRELVQDTDQYVRAHPWQSIGIAVGLGLIIGLLLGRRS